MPTVKKKLQDNLSLSSKLFLRTVYADFKRTAFALAEIPFRFVDRVFNVVAPGLAARRYSQEPPGLPATDLIAAARMLWQTTPTVNRSPDIKTSIIIPVFNKAAFTLQCIHSLLRQVSLTETEIIVVNNASLDDTPEMLSALGELVTVIDNEENRGFVDACNEGAVVARGKYLVFLNNDTKVLSGWLRHLVETIEADESVGAAGSMFLYPEGTIQEAGSIVWKNGDAHHYGWGGSPDDKRFNFAREVDYCSGASLMIRKELFGQLGGFDRRFAPAYYEDVDLCFGVRSLGYKVVYQPMSRLVHYEGVTAGRDVNKGIKHFQIINHQKFAEKWRGVLEREHLQKNLKQVDEAARRHLGPHVLVFDERIPSPDRDAGSARMFMILKALNQWSHVVFVPFNRPQGVEYEQALWKEGIETADAVDYGRLLKTRNVKAAIVSRPGVAEAMLPRIQRANKDVIKVFDMVDAHFIRLERESQISGDPQIFQAAQQSRETETRLARESDLIWCNSSEDKRVMDVEAPGQRIEVIPTIHALHGPGRSFEERRDLLFVGNLAHRPNSDAVHFLMRDIYPRLRQALPDANLFIVGDYASPDLLAYGSEDVHVTGYVPDIDPLLQRCRVFLAPLRFGAGVKGKIGEAMSYGLPVVTTSIGAEGFGLTNEVHAMIADTPEAFAEAVARLYSEKELWQHLAQNSRQHVKENFTPDVIAKTINDPLKEVIQQHAPRET